MNLEAHRVVDFSFSVASECTQVMSMRLKKVCPHCDATLHVRKLACPRGHVFPAKAQQMCQTLISTEQLLFLRFSKIPKSSKA